MSLPAKRRQRRPTTKRIVPPHCAWPKHCTCLAGARQLGVACRRSLPLLLGQGRIRRRGRAGARVRGGRGRDLGRAGRAAAPARDADRGRDRQHRKRGLQHEHLARPRAARSAPPGTPPERGGERAALRRTARAAARRSPMAGAAGCGVGPGRAPAGMVPRKAHNAGPHARRGWPRSHGGRHRSGADTGLAGSGSPGRACELSTAKHGGPRRGRTASSLPRKARSASSSAPGGGGTGSPGDAGARAKRRSASADMSLSLYLKTCRAPRLVFTTCDSDTAEPVVRARVGGCADRRAPLT
jgi:hypothetical protein